MKTRGPSRSNHGRRAGAGLIVDSEASLRWLKATPDLALQELSERLDEVHEVIAPTSTINDWFRARKISFKKTAHASEQERADGQAARVVWRQRQAWLLAHPERVGRTACLDETSINTKMARMRGAVPEASGWLPPLPMVIGKRVSLCKSSKTVARFKIDATSQYTRDYLYSTDPILFASIPSGQWVPGWDFPIGSDGTVIDDAGYLDIIHVFNHAPHAHFPSAELVAHHVPHAVEEIDEDVLFASAPMHNHLGHWLVDFLPRLQGRTLAGCSSLRIAVPDTLSGAKIEETLALAGLYESDILRCRTDALYRFRTLHIYRMGRSLPPNPLHVHFLRDLLAVKSPPAQHDGKKKRIFFDRANVGSRLVANKKEFDAVLLEYDFVSVNLGGLTLA